MKQKFEKWDRWLETILSEVQSLILYQSVYQELQAIINKNKDIQKPSVFYDFMFSSYAAWAVMTVRRLVKSQGDSVSFTGLLKDLKQNHALLSRKWFVSLYPEDLKEFAEKDFDRVSGASGLNCIDPTMINNDLDQLGTAAKTIEDFADKVVAHHDQRKPKKLPTWKDLDSCISLLEKLARKYRLLLRAVGGSSLLPVIQYDWKAVFYKPWITSRKT